VVDDGAVSIDWGGYEPYEPGIAASPVTLPRVEARQAFKRCMETKSARIEMLSRLLQTNGVDLDTSDAAIQDFNEWFYARVEADPENPGQLLPNWYSVIHDAALFLGDVMIERHPNLHWEFFTWGKKNVAFQKHVIMGMSTEDPKFRTNIDIDRMVSMYAHRIIESRGSVPSYGTVDVRGAAIDVDAAAARHRGREIETDAFWRWLRLSAQRA
jgi:hypothetical protein